MEYTVNWLAGNGAVGINNLMEDAATAEISRCQVWQWRRNRVVLDTGRRVTADMITALLDEATETLADTWADSPGRQGTAGRRQEPAVRPVHQGPVRRLPHRARPTSCCPDAVPVAAWCLAADTQRDTWLMHNPAGPAAGRDALRSGGPLTRCRRDVFHCYWFGPDAGVPNEEAPVHLTPADTEKLLLAVAGMVARDRLARGVKLNYPETVALLTTWVIERARDGRRVADLMVEGREVLTRDQVMDGVAEMLPDVQVEATFPDGRKLVTIHQPIA